MKRLNVSELLQVADLVADLPNTEDGTSSILAEFLGVKQVKYFKNYDDMKFFISNEEFTPVELFKKAGNWYAAVSFAMLQEYEQYDGNVLPNKWVRCAALSAICGFDSGYTLGSAYEAFTESEYGIFFGSRNNIKIVTTEQETTCSIAQFLNITLK